MAGEAEGEHSGTDSVEDASGDFGTKPRERQSEKGGDQGILLERGVIGVLARQQASAEVDGPGEVGRSLMKMGQHEPAENSARRTDCRRNQYSHSHEAKPA